MEYAMVSPDVLRDALKVATWAARMGLSDSDCIKFVTFVTVAGYLGQPYHYGNLMHDYLAETRN